MDCFADFISLNDVTAILKMLEENQVRLSCFAVGGVWISHYKIKCQPVVKHMEKYLQVYLVYTVS